MNAPVAQVAPQAPLRDPSVVMRLSRLGSIFPTRLSFLRSLLREMAADGATVTPRERVWDADGYGHATFQTTLAGRVLTLCAWTSALDDDARSDRVIAEAWDACFVLYDGVPDAATIARLGEAAKVQEAGRYDPKVLVVSRANKSVRLFEAVADALASGEQPDAAMLSATGYLMRTTAVYGNGKFGMADREAGSHPFRLEMLAVYMIRTFTLALVDHVAKARGGAAAYSLSRASQRLLGIGNSTGLGMAPFLVSHPVLLNNWMMVRETALARVRASRNHEGRSVFEAMCRRTGAHLAQWNVDDEGAQADIVVLRQDFAAFLEGMDVCWQAAEPWDALLRLSQEGGEDLQELVVSLVLEPHGALVDGLTHCMGADHDGHLDATSSIGSLKGALHDHYEWAMTLDLSKSGEDALVWYVSEEKLEPRLGQRSADFAPDHFMPHDIAKQVQALAASIGDHGESDPVAVLLMRHPEHRAIVRRVQTIARHPFGEIRDNLVAAGTRPIDMLRCKLSFFGASRFDPRSDRWTRIALFSGAPLPDELVPGSDSGCFLPALG